MPSHQHVSVSSTSGTVNDYFGGSTANYGFGDGDIAINTHKAMSTFTGGGRAHNHGATTASSPGTNSQLSSSQSILNPYIVSSKWIRVE